MYETLALEMTPRMASVWFGLGLGLLFGALAADGAACYTVLIDRTVDGSYRDQMSDHLPVVVVLPGAALPCSMPTPWRGRSWPPAARFSNG